MNTSRKVRTLLAVTLLICTLGSQAFFGTPVHAAITNWMRGANIVPTSTTDFGSATFKQSLQNLKATGATSVALVVPYYQSNTGSTDIAPGYNTPTDASLASAIDYAHSIGFSVAIKVHIESYDGSWRAYINPQDRTTWFSTYGNYVVHLGQIGAQHHAEMFVIGTELVSMAASQVNSTNTQNWINLIHRVRAVYSGSVTYDANSNNNGNEPFNNEKKFIGFWSYLDYATLSVYFQISSGDNSIQSLESSWDYWNKNDLQSFQQTVGKPLLFGEVGYRSVSGAHLEPWNWSRQAGVDLTEQANDYQALFEYWNAYSYMQGVYLWNWSTDPNAGGTNSGDYTPQGKPALQTMTRWFSSPPTPPPPSSNPMFRDTTTIANPTQPTTGVQTTVTTNVQDTSGSLSNGIVDVEVYDSSSTRVAQKYVEAQSFATNASQAYTAQFTPSAAGKYRVAVGVFNANWSQNYYWNNDALDITVGSAATQPPPSTNPPPPQGPQPTDIWWPADSSHLSGVQPLKAMVENTDVSQYKMTWQVDGGAQVTMDSNATDYPHKEVLVDFSGWHWHGNGPYTITFTSTNPSGNLISQKSIQIYTQ
jgi:hypothetical protein